MENRVGEFEFDIRTIVKHVARSWKLLIIIMIIGMIMLPLAVQGIRQQNGISNNEEVSLSEIDEIQIERYLLADTMLQGQEEYMKKHQQILSISPEQANAYVLRYVIIDEENLLDRIKTAYYTKIVDNRDIDSNRLLTGVCVSSNWDALVITQNKGSENGLYVKIYNHENVSDFKKEIETTYEEICAMGLEHELLLVEESKEDEYDYSLAMYKKAIFEENIALIGEAAPETYYLSEAALQHLGLIEIEEVSTKMSTKELIVYAVFGTAAGFLLMSMLVLVKYVCSKSPNTSTDIMSVFGVKLLGKIQTEKIYKTDVLIDNIFGDKEKKYADERWIKSTVEEVFVDVELTEIAVINLTKSEEIEAVCSLYQDLLDGIKFDIIEAPYGALENTEIISSYKGALLVVRKNSTLYELVNDYIDLCKKCRVKLLGYIVVD